MRICSKKALAAAFVVCLLVPGVFAGDKKAVSGGLTIKPGVLLVGIEIGYPPLEYWADDGVTPAGFDVEIAKALAAKLGLEVEFLDTAWDGIFDGVRTGKYDCIISSVTITPERLEVFNITRPYIGSAMTIVAAQDSPVEMSKPEDIAGYRVTYQAETTADVFVTRIAQSGVRFESFEYDKIINCFDELKLNRADIVVVESLVAFEYLDKYPGRYRIVWQGTVDEYFGIILKKGNDALTAKLDQALGEMFADGTMLKIANAFFPDEYSVVPQPAGSGRMKIIAKMAGWVPALLKGACVTISLTVAAVSVGLGLSLFLALGKISRNKLVSRICSGYIFFFRGTPLLMQLYFIYYGLPQISSYLAINNRFVAALIAFGLNAAAYCAEIIRAAIQSIDKGQAEAAKALGMSYARTMRLVIIPQSIRRLIPPVGNEFIMVLKDASLVSIIALTDITKATRSISSSTGSALVYIPALVLYLIITAVFTYVFHRLEKKYSVYE